MKNVSIIVAHDYNRVIGHKGKIPWHIKEDLQRFKQLTTEQVVIMGRRTYESLPKWPLPARVHVVISQDPKNRKQVVEKVGEDAYVTDSLIIAVENMLRVYPEKKIFLIGGEGIYQEALDLDLVDRIYCTLVDGVHDGDTHFPLLPVRNWDMKEHIYPLGHGVDVSETPCSWYIIDRARERDEVTV